MINNNYKELEKSLIVCGVNPLILKENGFDLKSQLKDIEYKEKDFSRKISVKKQLKFYEDLKSDPFSSYIACISSQHTANKAQITSLSIFKEAFTEFQLSHKLGATRPLWYFVKSGFEDTKIKLDKVSLLVLDGLVENSTDHKLEKARDILYNRSGPTIVITSDICPIEFMYKRLHFKCHVAINISNTKNITL